MGKQYLYGAAVQGIQSFIFRTNKLKDIVEASRTVDYICTNLFNKVVGKDYVAGDMIVQAAGNVKYIFQSEEECKRVVRIFPREVMRCAPGITISQAVVEYNEDSKENFVQCVDELERKLKVQRNIPQIPLTFGLLGMERNSSTGLPITYNVPNESKQEAERDELFKKAIGNILTEEKIRKSTNINKFVAQNDWIAVVHADGNGLGKFVQEKGKDGKDAFRKFSSLLSEDTQRAAQEAFKKVYSNDTYKLQDDKKVLPYRPIVLGGDDFTFICRGDLAIPLVKEFLSQFEEQTAQNIQTTEIKGLTACAGIAFMKSSFPFYYGYDLAGALCERAKKGAKKINEDKAPSCLMFHKIEDSFVQVYDDIVARELQPQKNISFEFGPYYLKEQEGHWTIDELVENVDKLKEDKEWNAVKSRLRNWITLLHQDEEIAKQDMRRILKIHEKEKTYIETLTKVGRIEFKVDDPIEVKHIPTYDVLALHTINTQITKEEKK